MPELRRAAKTGVLESITEVTEALGRHHLLVAQRTASMREMVSRSRDVVARSRLLLQVSRDIRWK